MTNNRNSIYAYMCLLSLSVSPVLIGGSSLCDSIKQFYRQAVIPAFTCWTIGSIGFMSINHIGSRYAQRLIPHHFAKDQADKICREYHVAGEGNVPESWDELHRRIESMQGRLNSLPRASELVENLSWFERMMLNMFYDSEELHTSIITKCARRISSGITRFLDDRAERLNEFASGGPQGGGVTLDRSPVYLSAQLCSIPKLKIDRLQEILNGLGNSLRNYGLRSFLTDRVQIIHRDYLTQCEQHMPGVLKRLMFARAHEICKASYIIPSQVWGTYQMDQDYQALVRCLSLACTALADLPTVHTEIPPYHPVLDAWWDTVRRTPSGRTLLNNIKELCKHKAVKYIDSFFEKRLKLLKKFNSGVPQYLPNCGDTEIFKNKIFPNKQEKLIEETFGGYLGIAYERYLKQCKQYPPPTSLASYYNQQKLITHWANGLTTKLESAELDTLIRRETIGPFLEQISSAAPRRAKRILVSTKPVGESTGINGRDYLIITVPVRPGEVDVEDIMLSDIVNAVREIDSQAREKGNCSFTAANRLNIKFGEDGLPLSYTEHEKYSLSGENPILHNTFLYHPDYWWNVDDGEETYVLYPNRSIEPVNI